MTFDDTESGTRGAQFSGWTFVHMTDSDEIQHSNQTGEEACFKGPAALQPKGAELQRPNFI